MKTLKTPALFAVALAAALVILHAQDAVIPPSSPTPAAPEPPSLMPEQTLPQPSTEATPQTSGTEAVASPTPLKRGTAEQLRQAIRIRELKTRLLEEPAIHDQRVLADTAKTDAGRRAALRNFYTLLYTKIEKIDPSLHDVVEGMLYNQLLALEQANVRPSKLLEPIAAVPGSHSEDHATPTPAPDDESDSKKDKTDDQ